MSHAPITRLPFTGSICAIASLILWAGAAPAQLALTPSNLGRGFVLTDYTFGLPHVAPNQIGPAGVAFVPPQGVLISDVANQSLYSLPSHADHQDITSAVVLRTAGPAPFPGFAFAQVQIAGTWHFYTDSANCFAEVDPLTGATTDVIPGVGGVGMAPFPTSLSGPDSGHVFVMGFNSTIWDIDPVLPSASPILADNRISSVNFIAFTADGQHLLMTKSDSLLALNLSTANVDWTAPAHPSAGVYNGVAVGVGNLDGYVYVNCTNGQVWEFGTPWGPHPTTDNLLLSGGSYGCTIAADPNVMSGTFPSLLLTQSDRITRLDPPGGGWFGPPSGTMQPISGPTAVGTSLQPLRTRILASTPDPARGPVRIDFVLAQQAQARLAIIDVQGREIAVMVDGTLGPGPHHAVWDGLALRGRAPAGVYYARLQAGGVVSTGSIVIAR